MSARYILPEHKSNFPKVSKNFTMLLMNHFSKVENCNLKHFLFHNFKYLFKFQDFLTFTVKYELKNIYI